MSLFQPDAKLFEQLGYEAYGEYTYFKRILDEAGKYLYFINIIIDDADTIEKIEAHLWLRDGSVTVLRHLANVETLPQWIEASEKFFKDVYDLVGGVSHKEFNAQLMA